MKHVHLVNPSNQKDQQVGKLRNATSGNAKRIILADKDCKFACIQRLKRGLTVPVKYERNESRRPLRSTARTRALTDKPGSSSSMVSPAWSFIFTPHGGWQIILDTKDNKL